MLKSFRDFNKRSKNVFIGYVGYVSEDTLVK